MLFLKMSFVKMLNRMCLPVSRGVTIDLEESVDQSFHASLNIVQKSNTILTAFFHAFKINSKI